MISRRTLLSAVTAAALSGNSLGATGSTIRVGTLRFGTAGWEMDVILRNAFDKTHGITIEPVEFATNQATQIALQSNSVDIILTDWLITARQRANGTAWTFAPFSTSVGALIAPQTGPVRTLTDLPGTRLGIAGSAIDKSWLILQAYAKHTLGLDLGNVVTKNFGAPPLLAEQLQASQIDSMLTYWPNAAKAEAAGMRRVLSIEDAIRGLGINATIPFVGYVFIEEWANGNRAAIEGFLAAAHQAADRLAKSDEEWKTLRPLMGASNDGEFNMLKDAYRRGILRRWGDVERQAAGQLYEIMAQIGGTDLVGPSSQIPPGTFW